MQSFFILFKFIPVLPCFIYLLFLPDIKLPIVISSSRLKIIMDPEI
uniref:Uncharacterized protein n=1 Tax=uncultured Desulfobacterium sp. TaxID=201089 RepID=E1YM27_9BACT|nr:unknown protein [uncultured Desulfobacterium sp.]